MSYHKTTLISGYNTRNDRPTGETNYDAIVAFSSKHFRTFVMRGHWRPKVALRYARSHGIVTDVTITHHVSDLSGHGRGGIDARYIARGDAITNIPVTDLEDQAAADMDLEAVWAE
jgi:hypothetical protein